MLLNLLILLTFNKYFPLLYCQHRGTGKLFLSFFKCLRISNSSHLMESRHNDLLITRSLLPGLSNVNKWRRKAMLLLTDRWSVSQAALHLGSRRKILNTVIYPEPPVLKVIWVSSHMSFLLLWLLLPSFLPSFLSSFLPSFLPSSCHCHFYTKAGVTFIMAGPRWSKILALLSQFAQYLNEWMNTRFP